MNLKSRLNRIEETANRQQGLRLIVAYRQPGESEQEAVERCEKGLQEPRKGNGLVILSESDLNL